MQPVDFFGVPSISFGCGRIATLSGYAAAMGRRPLVVCNGGAVDAVVANLPADFEPVVFRQRGEPRVEDVDAGLLAAREGGCDFLIGVGGGSALDAAKAIAGLLTNGGEALDYMEVVGRGRKITRPAAPWIAVPTTAGTGAEVTRNAVIASPAHSFKASIRGEQLLPRLALIDPELGVGTPANVTAASGMDALCQLIESYTSINANPLTDGLALEGIDLAERCLERAWRDGRDIAARKGMAMAALMSGITLTSAGLGAVHGLAAPLGARFPVPHGVVCAALLPGAIAANVDALTREGGSERLSRYARLGRMLAGKPALEEPAAIRMLITRVRALTNGFAIPPLSSFGLAESDLADLAELARKSSSMRCNPVMLSVQVLANILRGAL